MTELPPFEKGSRVVIKSTQQLGTVVEVNKSELDAHTMYRVQVDSGGHALEWWAFQIRAARKDEL